MQLAEDIVNKLLKGDRKALARAITMVENNLIGYQQLMRSLQINQNVPVIGFTGPPGAGKSSLVNSYIGLLGKNNLRTGVIAVDPTSPFNLGSILGDRIRMSSYFTDDNVFIRSLANRGALGGLSAKTVEICDLMRSSLFDHILIETVGVGQSEIEISGLADVTVLVLVPEAGDEIQQLKSGIMEIADIFVVNKCDRPGASGFAHSLYQLLSENHTLNKWPSVIKTNALDQTGIIELQEAINLCLQHKNKSLKPHLLADKAWHLIRENRMQHINRERLLMEIKSVFNLKDFNLYAFLNEKGYLSD